ncbi:hypothetical protein EBR25_05165 [bacterium]|nr:hypothetical protein [bacterium]
MSICLEHQVVYLDREAAKSKTTLHILAVLLLAISLSHRIWVKLEGIELGYQIAELREETQALNYERQELELQYSVATRPDLLAKRAYDELNLKQPETSQITRIVAGVNG